MAVRPRNSAPVAAHAAQEREYERNRVHGAPVAWLPARRYRHVPGVMEQVARKVGGRGGTLRTLPFPPAPAAVATPVLIIAGPREVR